MNIEQSKKQIKDNIDQIEQLNLSKLYPDNPNVGLWNDRTNSETKKFVQNIISLIKELKNNSELLDSAGFGHIQGINAHLANFITQVADVQSLSEEQITTQHHNPLNQLDALNNILRSSGLYTEIKLIPKLKEKLDILKKVDPLAKDLLVNSQNLESAIKQANKWLETKSKIDEQTIRGQATAFLDRAKEHKIGGEKIYRNFFKKKIYTGRSLNNWLVTGLLFSSLVGIITYIFIQEDREVSVGQSILKIASILVPTYLTVFSANQYLYHKKMYETYMFKYASLHTMNNLMSTKAEVMQEKVLIKGLDVLFAEPTIKEDGAKHDKQLISELLGMLKAQMNK